MRYFQVHRLYQDSKGFDRQLLIAQFKTEIEANIFLLNKNYACLVCEIICTKEEFNDLFK